MAGPKGLALPRLHGQAVSVDLDRQHCPLEMPVKIALFSSLKDAGALNLCYVSFPKEEKIL